MPAPQTKFSHIRIVQFSRVTA